MSPRRRRASSSTSQNPALCRVRAYSAPGLPRPTTNLSGTPDMTMATAQIRKQQRASAGATAGATLRKHKRPGSRRLRKYAPSHQNSEPGNGRAAAPRTSARYRRRGPMPFFRALLLPAFLLRRSGFCLRVALLGVALLRIGSGSCSSTGSGCTLGGCGSSGLCNWVGLRRTRAVYRHYRRVAM